MRSLAVLLSAFLPSCASIVSSSTWPVTVSTAPPGAEVTVRNQAGTNVHSGQTPFTVMLASSAGYFDAEEYTLVARFPQGAVEAKLNAELNGWYLGNLIFGGLIGLLIVDPATGAMHRLPDTVTVLQNGGIVATGSAPAP